MTSHRRRYVILRHVPAGMEVSECRSFSDNARTIQNNRKDNTHTQKKKKKKSCHNLVKSGMILPPVLKLDTSIMVILIIKPLMHSNGQAIKVDLFLHGL